MNPSRSAGTLRGTGRGISAVTALEPAQAVTPVATATGTQNDSAQQGAASRWLIGAAARAALMRLMEQPPNRNIRRVKDRGLLRARAYDEAAETCSNAGDESPHTDIEV
jgi:hypothetical protein